MGSPTHHLKVSTSSLSYFFIQDKEYSRTVMWFIIWKNQLEIYSQIFAEDKAVDKTQKFPSFTLAYVLVSLKLSVTK